MYDRTNGGHRHFLNRGCLRPLFLYIKGGLRMKYTYQIAEEYKKDLKELRKLHVSCEDDAEKTIISGMISSTEYALFWIQTGHERRPHEKRPVSNLSKEQRTQYWGEVEHSNYLVPEEPRTLEEWEHEFIEDMLGVLTSQEKDVYIAVYGKENSYSETAEYLGITKSQVQNRIEQARKKLDHALLYGAQKQLI